MRRRIIRLAFLACLACAVARGDYIEVRRPATVYSEPSRTSDPAFKAQTGAQFTLLENETQGGYYHVEDSSTGQSGWIYRTLVRRHAGAVPASAATSSSASTGGGFPATKCTPPYNEEPGEVTAFDLSCGLTGGAAKNSGEFVQNPVKNDLCEKGSPQPVTISDLAKLQQIVPDHGKPPKDRTFLQNLPPLAGGLKLEESDLVSYVGFLVEAHYMPQSETKPKKGKGGESVNCNSTEHVKADIHLALSDTKGRIKPKDANRIQRLCSTISAEMIPHLRPGVWNLDNLSQVIDLERPVRIMGPLFYDGSHEPCTGATPHGSDPRRIAEWEIHPIYTFEVCKFDAVNKCDPDKASSWQPLSKANDITLEQEVEDQ